MEGFSIDVIEATSCLMRRRWGSRDDFCFYFLFFFSVIYGYFLEKTMWLRILGVDLNEASILEAGNGEGEGEGVECGVVDGLS